MGVDETVLGATIVFLVQHSRELPNDAVETKVIGVFATEAEAQMAVATLSSKPGFRDHPNSFYVDRYPLNQVHWEEGFSA